MQSAKRGGHWRVPRVHGSSWTNLPGDYHGDHAGMGPGMVDCTWRRVEKGSCIQQRAAEMGAFDLIRMACTPGSGSHWPESGGIGLTRGRGKPPASLRRGCTRALRLCVGEIDYWVFAGAVRRRPGRAVAARWSFWVGLIRVYGVSRYSYDPQMGRAGPPIPL
jgi:hypothetical protein